MIKSIGKIFHQESELQKSLSKSCLTKDNFVFRQEDLDFVLQFMIEEENIRDFFEYYAKSEMQTYTIKMKMLIIIHQVINLSEEFSEIFSNTKFLWFSRLQHCNRNNEKWMLQNIQLPMISYLQKLALNMKEIKSYRTCLFRKQIISINLMIDSFKLVNIVNQALSFVPNFFIALTNYPYDFLIKKVAFSVYSETLSFQRQLINSLSVLISDNSSAQRMEILEFLREIQTIEQKLTYFYSFHKKFDPANMLQPPLKLQIDLETAQEIDNTAIYNYNVLEQQNSSKSSRETHKDSILKRQLLSAQSRRSRDSKNSYKEHMQYTIQEVFESSADEYQKQASVIKSIN